MKFALPAGTRPDFSMAVPLMVALLLLAGLWIIYQNEQTYRQEQQRATHVQAEILAASVTAALDFDDNMAAQEAADALRASQQVQLAGIYDADGKLFAGYHRSTTALPAAISGITRSGETLIHETVPVTRGGMKIGTIYLASAVDPLSRRISRYAMIALLVLMTSLVLAVLGYGQFALRRANRTLAETNRHLEFEMEERSRTEEQLRQAQAIR